MAENGRSASGVKDRAARSSVAAESPSHNTKTAPCFVGGDFIGDDPARTARSIAAQPLQPCREPGF